MAITKPTSITVFERALAVEVGRLDVLRERAWLALGVGIMGAAALVSLYEPLAGMSGLALGATLTAWFAIRRVVIANRELRAANAVDMFFESTAAPALFALLAVFVGGEAAFDGFGPTLTFGGVMVLSVLRLQPRVTAAIAIINALLFGVVSLAILAIEPSTRADPAHSPYAITLRFASFALAGIVTAFVAGGLRSAMGSVVVTARERDVFGKYRLEGQIASGGMGVVWRAVYCPEGGFERPAAVKLVHAHLANNPTFVDAFRAEAALCACLVHDGIVQVFDFGRVDGRYFLAMERIDGVTLSELMRAQRHHGMRAPPEVVRAIGRALLGALAYAHEDARDARGALLHIVHRDVAPSNVLVSMRGVVKLTDFGIAKALGEARAAHTENVVGHLDHMAPEQVSAGPLDARTDLFSAATLLWELLCGRSLFRRANDAATLAAVANPDVPAPSTVDPALAPWDAFFKTALAREPADRFASARAMSAAMPGAEPATPESIAAFVSALAAAGGLSRADGERAG